MKGRNTDQTDLRILRLLQRDSTLSQRDMAEIIGISQNALWRRLQALGAGGYITGYHAALNRAALDLNTVAFVMIRTNRHARDWLEAFRKHVVSIPEVVDFYRISGDYDYMLKIVTRDLASYDRIYQQLIEKVELQTVTTCFAMEALAEQRPLHMP